MHWHEQNQIAEQALANASFITASGFARANCPFCNRDRKQCLSINVRTGWYKCWKCATNGRINGAADKVDTPYDYESLAAAGTMLGSGGLIVMDDTTNVVAEVLRITSFYMHESCGKCTPCREGTRWMYQILSEIQNKMGKPEQLDLLNDICDNMSFKCFCPLGDAAIAPVLSSIEYFREDYEALLESAKTPVG